MDQDPSITERNAGIENGLAQCYHALQDYDKAMDYYQIAIEGEKQPNTTFLMNRA